MLAIRKGLTGHSGSNVGETPAASPYPVPTPNGGSLADTTTIPALDENNSNNSLKPIVKGTT